MPSLILSPCGTSLLTNQAGEDRRLVTRYSNAKAAEDIPAEDRARLEQVIGRARETLLASDAQAVIRLSAELNAITRFYDGQPRQGAQDQHILVCTDTWLGETTAQLVGAWLEAQGINSVQVHRQADLRTLAIDEFQLALSDLTLWCAQTLPGYRAMRYHVVFNLTGGFKSVNGFLQTLAMLYADETIYVFESGDQLLRLPRLPLQMADDALLREHVVALRRLSRNLPVAESVDMPETFIMRIDDEVALSPWGQVVWQEKARALYGEQLWPSPSPRIRYADSFEPSLSGLAAERLWQVNQRIDDLAECLEARIARKRLDLKPLKGKTMLPSTHEIDAWADGDARRIFGHYESDVFVLDRLDKALH